MGRESKRQDEGHSGWRGQCEKGHGGPRSELRTGTSHKHVGMAGEGREWQI